MVRVNPPAIAGQFHANFVGGIKSRFDSEKSFSISESAENQLRISMLESGWMMNNITLWDVDEEEGQNIEIGESALHTGRTIEGRFSRGLKIEGSNYSLADTDSCASLSYQRMSAIANVGGIEHFTQTVSDFFGMAISLDMLRIGFNGQRISYPTDPIANPKGEDVNIGWHAIAKGFNNGSQVITDAMTLGEGGDFPHLDALANHIITEKIPESFREDPRLVVMVGAELAAAERMRLFNSADRPADIAAAQMLTSSVAGRFAFVPPFMPGKRLVVTTLSNLHIYTQKMSRRFRAEFIDERCVYEHSYWRNEGYALGNNSLYAAVDENAISLVQR
ncbi:P2 family phage major capsid protein [Yersinia ruckeri]|uniref:P2 family phage major capsid protein n=1 Tax=Yersinia ruckeri TaxID=29486 RepID=UPI0005E404E3|nr:P2 family phage major capsid protein [Yersinia ruckeri]ELI6452981.1 P2 family phage major capsid protein [Yersinia ruckeri]MCK8538973.1 phage major capsid protein, P2 family [Yersinia ruckeri]MCK8570895.1 phage major capsid protein, P2 family [Yersinia ruckeri]MCK8577200.1 phage major capsid protein, P2 family [Yersinia ruckeri]MCK8581160.1 phage major capsid protein, P2 family [Yersinia ruckeri]